MDDAGAHGGVEWTGHHVAEGAEVLVGHLESCEGFTCGVDEEEVVDGRDKFELSVTVSFDEFILHG